MGSIIAERVKGATLTKAQRKIAKYFIHNPERVGMSSSMEVARAIGVSDASITRFARAIGYEGFTDLKADIYNSLVNQATGGVNSLSLADRFDANRARFGADTSRTEYMKLVQYDLERTFQQNTDETFLQAVHLLKTAAHRYVVGFRGCLGAAGQFAWLMRFLLPHVIHICDEGPGGFLAALLAGFAAGYIVELLKKITEKLPASLNGIRPMLIYPLGGMLILGAVMCGINPVMGMINTAMTDCLNAMGGTSKVLLGAIVAGMMSIDMGGPFNKAAYVFGTAALASGNYEVMAAVMVGGMVPPIAIALSTTFCPKKWTADERRNGIVNYVMGLCFVTEGAIPYAAADPLRVLPSCVAGAAVAGALSMTFGCALRAPHGGIFVFPVVDHTALYCVALAVGSVLGAVILSLLKKNRTDAE